MSNVFQVEFSEDVLNDGKRCIVARDPALPDCYGFGADEEEALRRLRAAREAHLRRNRPTPGREQPDGISALVFFSGGGISIAEDSKDVAGVV